MNAREELQGALDVIRTRGWCQANVVNSEGQVCILGALSAARGNPLEDKNGKPDGGIDEHYDKSPGAEALSEIIPREIRRDVIDGHPCTALWMWNDDHAENVTEVEDLINRAIATL